MDELALDRIVQSDAFPEIVNAIELGHCVPFLGAAASGGYKEWRNGMAEVPGCPSAEHLRDLLYGALQTKSVPDQELGRITLADLPSVADFYRYFDSGSRADMERRIRGEFARASGPRPIHSVIAALPQIRCAFTTNYDLLLEDAVTASVAPKRRLIGPYVYEQMERRQSRPTPTHTEIINREPGSADSEHPLVIYKMHGCITVPNSLLITTSDYVSYLSSWHEPGRGMPKAFRDLLSTRTFLFLGYGLVDWNFRVIWDAMIASLPNRRFNLTSYAVKTPVTKYETRLLKDQGIEVIDCDITTFARALGRALNVNIPEPPSNGGAALPARGGLA